MKTSTIYHLVVALILLVSSCQAPPIQLQPASAVEASVTPDRDEIVLPTETAAVSTLTPSPTFTLVVTDTPPPTLTPTATSTPTITPTPSPFTLKFAPGESIKIGYLLWETHPIGIDSKRAIEIAIRDYGGEIFGRKIELVGYNEECSELGGQRGAELLMLDRGVVGLIGTTCSAGALRASRVVSDAGRLMISPSNTLQDFTDPESRQPGYFRTVPNEIYQANAVARYAFEKLGLRKLASIFTSSSKTQQIRSEHLCRTFADQGGECVLERALEGGTTYMTPTANLIAASGADTVHIALGPMDAAALVAEIKQTPGLEEFPVFGWDILNSSGFLSEAGNNAVGVYVSTISYAFDRDAGEYQRFAMRYEETYHEQPLTDYHAYAYDAVNLLLNAVAVAAVQEADGGLLVDPLRVREAVYLLSGFPGLTGSLTCSEYGDCAQPSEGLLYQFVDGDPSTFNPGLPASLSSNPVQVWP